MKDTDRTGNDLTGLAALGWKPVYLQSLSLDELSDCRIGRVLSVDRDRLAVGCDTQQVSVRLHGDWHAAAGSERPTVGDWLLLTDTGHASASQAVEYQLSRILPRTSVLQRTAPGQEHRSSVEQQVLCANIDTAFVVAALDQSFNERRIERYLALVQGCGVQAVVVLTKADLSDDAQSMVNALRTRLKGTDVVALDATGPDVRDHLGPWCLATDTIVLLGPSGVGKSTLTNALGGRALQATQAVRAGDAKGRHTTTRRSLFALDGDLCLIDTPGMRELRLAIDEDSLDTSFDDIARLASACRFSDCGHAGEPGCAVAAALANGKLSQDRWSSYQRLRQEVRTQARLNESVHERREREKGFGRMVKGIMRDNPKRR
jgi:ribosome biogenesis GTPase